MILSSTAHINSVFSTYSLILCYYLGKLIFMKHISSLKLTNVTHSIIHVCEIMIDKLKCCQGMSFQSVHQNDLVSEEIKF